MKLLWYLFLIVGIGILLLYALGSFAISLLKSPFIVGILVVFLLWLAIKQEKPYLDDGSDW